MEKWELIKRLLAGATGCSQTFMARLIAGSYVRDLASVDPDIESTRSEVLDFAEELADQLQEVGLIRPVVARTGNAAILGAMERTEFGDELYQALSGVNGVMLFESMQADLEAGAIRRILHQLNS